MITIAHAVFDESGDTGKAKLSTRFFVVAGIVCSNFEILNRIVLRTRKDIPHKKRGEFPELKAHLADERITKKLLERLANEDIQIFAAIADKSKLTFETPNDLYHTTYCNVIKATIAHHKNTIIVLDMFYTRSHQQTQFTNYIANNLTGSNGVTTITFDKSHKNHALQAADFVAWAIYQHVEHSKEIYRNMIVDKIVTEITITE